MIAALEAPGIALLAEDLIALRRAGAGRTVAAPAAALPGGFATRKRGHGQEMADVREYVEGDDVRHLDRGSTARTGTLHVRTFHEERDRATLLVADFRPSMLWGTRRAFRSVAVAEALAVIGWRQVADGGRVGLLALTGDGPLAVPIRGRTRGMLGVIGGMVRAHAGALRRAAGGATVEPTLAEGLMRATRLAPAGAEVIVASGFDTAGADLGERLGQLARRRVPRLLHVADGATDRLPPGIYPIVTPDGTRRRVRISGESAERRWPDEIDGHPVLSVDAGAPLAETAALLAVAFPDDRVP